MAVSITDSVGYEGTVDEPQWARLMAYAGGRQYGVLGEADWKVTAGTADREIRIAPGSGFGSGVLDRTTATASLVLPAPASGSRWHLIAVRRDWQNNLSQFDSIAGTDGAAAIPARAASPGTSDDQPIALVRVQAGQSQPVEIRDLRVWGADGGAFAVDDLVLQYLTRLGTRVRIGFSTWSRVLDGLGNTQWRLTGASVEHQSLGRTVAGIAVPAGRVSADPIIKTGQVTDLGTIQYGNQYLAEVVFADAFPNELLSVQLTPIQTNSADGSPDTISPDQPLALDRASRTGFRAFVPRHTGLDTRSFLWLAVGR